jgi:hypothetical protein
MLLGDETKKCKSRVDHYRPADENGPQNYFAQELIDKWGVSGDDAWLSAFRRGLGKIFSSRRLSMACRAIVDLERRTSSNIEASAEVHFRHSSSLRSPSHGDSLLTGEAHMLAWNPATDCFVAQDTLAQFAGQRHCLSSLPQLPWPV